MRLATGLNRKLISPPRKSSTPCAFLMVMPSAPNEDLTPAKIIDPLRNGIGEVGVGLNIVEELCVTLAIDGPRFIRQVGGRLTLLPAPAVDNEDLVVAFCADGPE